MATPAAMYSTTTQSGIDVNAVFYLDTKSYPEYPTPPFIAGELAWGTDGSAWVYCTASITIGLGSVVIVADVPGSWSVALIGGATVATAPTGQLLGVVGGSKGLMFVGAPSGTQTGSYFWVQRAGNAQGINCAAATTKEALLFSSATVGGRVSSSGGGSGTTYTLPGIVVSQATGSTAGPNTAVLNYPTVGSAG
jgi:hypothetical protein